MLSCASTKIFISRVQKTSKKSSLAEKFVSRSLVSGGITVKAICLEGFRICTNFGSGVLPEFQTQQLRFMKCNGGHYTAPFVALWVVHCGRLQLKCDGTRAETRFRLSTKRTSPFTTVWESAKSTTGNRCVRISGSNAGQTMFRGSVKGTGNPLHSTVSPLHFPTHASPCEIGRAHV